MNDLQKERLYNLIGEKIKDLRSQRGFTQEQLAHQIDLTRTSIVNIEQGRQHPSLFLIFDICKALNVNYQELIPAEEDFMIETPLDKHILKGVSSSDAVKLTSFFNEFMKTTGKS